MSFKGYGVLCAPILFFFFIILFIILNQGCSKDELTTARGVVFNNGTYASGGCEWIIIIGQQQYKPDNLPLQCQQADTVEVTYRLVRTTVDCPPTQNYAGEIHLHRIRSITNGTCR